MTCLQISSGRGPVEVRRFVRLLGEYVSGQLGVPVIYTGPGDAPLSATLIVDASSADVIRARAVDRVSGLSVRASGERSQSQNRAVALERLQGRLDARRHAEAALAGAERRVAHDRVPRGAARFSWRLGADGRLGSPRHEHERVVHDHHATPLGLREGPPEEAPTNTLLDLDVPERGALDLG